MPTQNAGSNSGQSGHSADGGEAHGQANNPNDDTNNPTPASATHIAIGSQTLTQGGPAVTLANGQQASLGTAGVVLATGSPSSPDQGQDRHQPPSQLQGYTTIPLHVPAQTGAVIPAAGAASPSMTAQQGQKNDIIIGSTTLAPGSAIAQTLTSGGSTSVRTLSAASDGRALVVGGSTVSLSELPNPSSGESADSTTAKAVTFGHNALETYTASQLITTAPNGEKVTAAVVGGQTISPGQSITMSDGHTISLAENGTGVVMDGETAAFQKNTMGGTAARASPTPMPTPSIKGPSSLSPGGSGATPAPASVTSNVAAAKETGYARGVMGVVAAVALGLAV